MHFSIPFSVRLLDKEPADHPVSSTALSKIRQETVDGSANGTDIFGAETSFTVGKSPLNGVATSGGNFVDKGLGEGSPKVTSPTFITL